MQSASGLREPICNPERAGSPPSYVPEDRLRRYPSRVGNTILEHTPRSARSTACRFRLASAISRSGRRDLNPGPPAPKAELRHAQARRFPAQPRARPRVDVLVTTSSLGNDRGAVAAVVDVAAAHP